MVRLRVGLVPIGGGKWNTVFRVGDTNYILRESKPLNPDQAQRAKSETELTGVMARANIGPLIYWSGTRASTSQPGHVVSLLVSENYTHGSLYDYMYKTPLTSSQCDSLAEQILHLVCKIASLGFVNADIKPSNIVVKPTTNGNEARLIDFDFTYLIWIQPKDAAAGCAAMIGLLESHLATYPAAAGLSSKCLLDALRRLVPSARLPPGSWHRITESEGFRRETQHYFKQDHVPVHPVVTVAKGRDSQVGPIVYRSGSTPPECVSPADIHAALAAWQLLSASSSSSDDETPDEGLSGEPDDLYDGGGGPSPTASGASPPTPSSDLESQLLADLTSFPSGSRDEPSVTDQEAWDALEAAEPKHLPGWHARVLAANPEINEGSAILQAYLDPRRGRLFKPTGSKEFCGISFTMYKSPEFLATNLGISAGAAIDKAGPKLIDCARALQDPEWDKGGVFHRDGTAHLYGVWVDRAMATEQRRTQELRAGDQRQEPLGLGGSGPFVVHEPVQTMGPQQGQRLPGFYRTVPNRVLRNASAQVDNRRVKEAHFTGENLLDQVERLIRPPGTTSAEKTGFKKIGGLPFTFVHRSIIPHLILGVYQGNADPGPVIEALKDKYPNNLGTGTGRDETVPGDPLDLIWVLLPASGKTSLSSKVSLPPDVEAYRAAARESARGKSAARKWVERKTAGEELGRGRPPTREQRQDAILAAWRRNV